MESSFGPRLEGSFDFTLLFEQSIFSIIPSALFLCTSPIPITRLLRKHTLTRAGGLLWAKLGAVAILVASQLALLVVWASPSTPRTRVSLVAAALSLVSSCVVALLLYAQHKRSLSPSILLSGYLGLSALLDVPQARSLFLQPQFGTSSLRGLFVASLVTKFALLLLEEIPKRSLLVAGSKDVSLESTSGPISQSLFLWLNTLFFKGFRGFLQVPDLGNLSKEFDSEVLLLRLSAIWDKQDKRGKHSLVRATWRAFRPWFLAPILPRLFLIGFSFSQPFLVNKVISFIATPHNAESKDIAGGLISATALIYLGLAVSKCVYNHLTYRLTTVLRGGLVSLIFRKTLDLSYGTARSKAVVTLMSTDIDGIGYGIMNMHQIWANVVELGVAIYLLGLQVGPACVLAAVPAVVCSMLITRVAKGMGPARATWNKGIQHRVSATSSTLAQIKGIKMMGLSNYVQKTLHGLRVGELDLSKRFRTWITQMFMISTLSSQMTPAVVIAAAVFWTRTNGDEFSVSAVFTTLSIVALVSGPIAALMGSVPVFMSSLACFDRIQKFLLSEERQDERLPVAPASDGRSAKCRDSQASTAEKDTATLSEPVLEMEVQNLPCNKRVVFEHASFAIKSDEGAMTPVLRDMTISLSKSELTIVTGPVGCGKSTLLKAVLGEIAPSSGVVRIQGAASVAYCDQTAWLRNVSIRDNIIAHSEFDGQWYASVVHACALNEDISRFPETDGTLVGSGGITLSGGQKQRLALARAVYSRSDILLLDDVFSALDNATSRAVFSRTLGPDGLLRRRDATVLLATHAVHNLPYADNIVVLGKTGQIEQTGSYSDLQSSEGFVKQLALEASTSSSESQGSGTAEESSTPLKPKPKATSAPPPRDVRKRVGDVTSYKFYMSSLPRVFALTFLVLSIANTAVGCFPNIWLRIWSERGTNQGNKGADFAVYLAFCLGNVVLIGISVWWFMVVCIPKSATHFHLLLVKATLAAPLWWFAATDAGDILNRFSQDMTLVDQQLPMAFFEMTLASLGALASTALIASGAQYVAAVIPVCAACLYLLQMYYLRTSRQLRLLDLEAKTPLYTHFTETLAGVVTIRAFGWKPAFMRENLGALDHSQKPYYMMFCIQRWLAVVLDLFVAGIAVVLVAFAVELTSTTSSGAIGLALINIIGFNSVLSRLLTAWTSLETSLGAIARLRSFIDDTPQEFDPPEPQLPPKDWPSAGSIELGRVTAAYSLDKDDVLHAVSLSIKPGQKVGICGRTGSGKSSLLLTLAGLLETRSGTRHIDGLNLALLPRDAVRTHLTVLPQDPVQLQGSVRTNLDPDPGPDREAASDAACTAVLGRVHIWDVVAARGGLDADLDALGLSHGQLQLFCLARALLHKRRVVLVDEATSSVDGATDEAVQRVIRDEFAACTVLMVAHRLETICDADVVVVMDAGRVVEVGDPRVLVGDPASRFSALQVAGGARRKE